MKKLFLFPAVIIFPVLLNAQSVSFIKKITDDNNNNYCTSIISGINGSYYNLFGTSDSIGNLRKTYIIKFDDYAVAQDSLQVNYLFGKNNQSVTYIENYYNDILYWTTLSDSTHNYMYAAVINTNLQTIEEKIIDTLAKNEWVSRHIVNKAGHHIFLTITDEQPHYKHLIYETDADFDLIRTADPHRETGYASSIIEIPADSSYLITAKSFIQKTDYNFSYFDTVPGRGYAGDEFWYGNTVTISDSTYIEEVFSTTMFIGTDFYPCLYTRTKNAEAIDTIVFITPWEDNRGGQYHDFIDYITPDTLFYCGIADFKHWMYPESSRILIAKFNAQGDIYWQKYFGGDANFRNGSVAATQDGGCIVQWNFWDWQNYSNWMNNNIILIKTDKYGNVSSGIDDDISISNKQILVFPNPAHDHITFETGLYKNISLQLFSTTGQLISQKYLSQGSNTIDIHKYRSGIYFYRLTSGSNFIESGSFIKE